MHEMCISKGKYHVFKDYLLDMNILMMFWQDSYAQGCDADLKRINTISQLGSNFFK